MNRISPLDIRVAVFAQSFAPKKERGISSLANMPLSSISYDKRIVSLYKKSPKPLIPKSKTPSLIRKGQLTIIRVWELLKAILEVKETTSVFSEIAPPRRLLVPQLPDPRFRSARPPFFWHPSCEMKSDEYAPSCLMSEAKEDLPCEVRNSRFITAHAQKALPKTGILRQETQGFVYLELPNAFIDELLPLIEDKQCQAAANCRIPVILPDEMEGWRDIEELGQTFSFKIDKFYALEPKRWPGVEKVYFLSLSSPELEQFRESCLLPSRIRGHQFHIAIAVVQETEGPKQTPQRDTFRLNVSCFAA